MAEASHLSIGEVLAQIQVDFPDVTISKIRFLESQGLLDPERTPSGYRKFYPSDVAQLRWILTQQRDRFLPLKVIKEQLDANGGDIAAVPEDDLDDAGQREAQSRTTRVAALQELPEIFRTNRGEGDSETSDESSDETSDESAPIDEIEVIHADSPAVATEPDPTEVLGKPAPASLLGGPEQAASLTLHELAAAVGVELAIIDELQSFGLIRANRIGAENYYTEDAVLVAKAAARFLGKGVEVRHLRMYKVAAEREAGFFEQLVMPMLKQRNPAARDRAVEVVQELAEVGETLHQALLRAALRNTLP